VRPPLFRNLCVALREFVVTRPSASPCGQPEAVNFSFAKVCGGSVITPPPIPLGDLTLRKIDNLGL
jgi:hypothetical protein